MLARAALAVTGVIGALVVLPAVATAMWSASGSGSRTVAAATMINATGFTATCATSRRNTTIDLVWTPSPHPYVSGYQIVRTGAGTGSTSTTLTVTGGGTSSTTDTPPTIAGTSYTYTIRATTSPPVVWTTTALAATGSPSFTSNSCTS